MEVQVRKLREALALLGPVIPKKATMPILSHVLLKDGRAMATNLEVTVSLEFPEAELQDPVLLRGDALEFLKTVPGDAVAQVSQANRTVVIACEGSRTTVPSLKPEEFPKLSEAMETPIEWDGDRLIDAIADAQRYAAGDDTRPVLHAVALLMEAERLSVFAADGFRLFLKEFPWECAAPETAIIPYDTVPVLEHLWKKALKKPNVAAGASLAGMAVARRMIDLGFTGGRMCARFGDVTLYSQLISGTVPNFRPLIPNPTNRVKFFAPDLYQAAIRVSDVAKGGSNIVRLTWSGKTMKVFARGEERETETEIPLLEGGEGRIALNCTYLLDYLKEKQGIVEMGITTVSSPILMLDGRHTVVLMPMFVQWDGEKTPAKTEAEAAELAKEAHRTATGRDEDDGESPPTEETEIPPEDMEGEGNTPQEPAEVEKPKRKRKANASV